MPDGKYPEHEKLAAIKEETATVQRFVDRAAQHGYHVCKLRPSGMFTMDDDELQEWAPVQDPNEPMAAAFGIDLAKLRDEKEEMFETMRARA